MRRIGRCLAACCAALACTIAGSANAAPGMLVGVADDGLKWGDQTQAKRALAYTRDLGLRAVRVTVPWSPGETRLPVADRPPVDRMILATWGAGLRVVLAVYGKPGDAPQTNAADAQYCTFAASLLRRYPSISDIVVWNEPNTSRFWRPQFDADGSSVAPAAYEALLARCWDTLHAVRPGVNVIDASAARGNDDPSSRNPSHSPVTFYSKIGEAYRQSGRRARIFDTVGHNPYASTNGERPWVRHTTSKMIGEGDYDRLIAVLTNAFGGTGQPVPGEGRVAIWYMEQGFQTTIDPGKARLYTGAETTQVLPPWLGGNQPWSADGPAPDQATQLTDALNVAYCQPAVAAFFNFELADESGLRGWQSGLLWADQTPKPSYRPFRTAVRNVAAGRVDCQRYAQAAAGAGAGIGFTTDEGTPPKKGKPPVFTVK